MNTLQRKMKDDNFLSKVVNLADPTALAGDSILYKVDQGRSFVINIATIRPMRTTQRTVTL